MADPEQYRSKEEVAQWRERDPIPAFGDRLLAEGVIDEDARAQIDAQALARVDAAVQFAEASPFPSAESLYDDVYVLAPGSSGSYFARTTDPQASADGAGAAAGAASELSPGGERSEIPQQMSEALAHGEDSA
jgi:pyruvate dehydrogenase E1 component alpha subunit